MNRREDFSLVGCREGEMWNGRHLAQRGAGEWNASQQTPSRYPQEGLTLPTSTRFVTMTMLAEFSCQIILQKSFTVSCMGPANREGVRVRLQLQGSRQEACPSWLVSHGSGWVSKSEVSDSYWDTSSGDWGLKRVRSECAREKPHSS